MRDVIKDWGKFEPTLEEEIERIKYLIKDREEMYMAEVAEFYKGIHSRILKPAQKEKLSEIVNKHVEYGANLQMYLDEKLEELKNRDNK